MSDYPMLISNKLHSFRNFVEQRYYIYVNKCVKSNILINNLLLFQFLYLTLQKIGFTSAIEASFIAFGLHYLCRYVT